MDTWLFHLLAIVNSAAVNVGAGPCMLSEMLTR